MYLTCAGVCGAIKIDLVYNNATLALNPLNDGACAVVAGSLFHRQWYLVLGRMRTHCNVGQSGLSGPSYVPGTCDLYDIG